MSNDIPGGGQLPDARRRRTHVALINPKAFVKSASNPDVPPPPRRVVILLHGFNSRGEWFADLQRLVLSLSDDRVVACPIPYRRVFALEFPFFALFGWVPIRIRRVRRDILALCDQYGVDKVSVLAHSFGTYVVANLLKRYPDVNFDNIVLCGSVVQQNFNWSAYRHRFTSITNDAGQADMLARWAALSCILGPSGRFGFHSAFVQNRFFEGIAHNDFFTDKFDKSYWTQLLINDLVEFPAINHPIDESWAVRGLFRVLSLVKVLCFWRVLLRRSRREEPQLDVRTERA